MSANDLITSSEEAPPPIEYWTPEDHFIGLCSVEEVGKLKPPIREAKLLARYATPRAVRALIEAAGQEEDMGAKVKAAQALLDRGWGKAEQTLDTKTDINVTISWATEQRLSYKNDPQVIENAEDVEPATPSEAPAPTPEVSSPVLGPRAPRKLRRDRDSD